MLSCVRARCRIHGARVIVFMGRMLRHSEGTFFDLLEHVARLVRKNYQPFGGIQVVLWYVAWCCTA